MNSHPNAPSANHCACCHVCHVSMRQRPRPAVGCSACKTILCQVCLRERFATDLWEEAAFTQDWLCPKCTQSCVCKSCKAKGNKARAAAAAPQRRATATAAANAEWQPEEDEEEEEPLFSTQSAFSAPRRKKKKRKPPKRKRNAPVPRAISAPPARGPSPPEMHASYQMTFSPMTKRGRLVNSLERPPQRLGLGFMLKDTEAPMHVKILELQKVKEDSQRTIAEMRNLLSLMELEHREVEASLQALIQEAAQQAAQQAAPKGMFKSASACSLQELEARELDAQQQSSHAAMGH